MKKVICLLAVAMTLPTLAQVGINTETPQATLHIATDDTLGPVSVQNGGMILEYAGTNRNSMSALSPEGIAQLQNQNILMQNSVTGEIEHIGRSALNYYPARPSSIGGAVSPVDHTILAQNNIALPNGPAFIGKQIHIIYDLASNANLAITGSIYQNGGSVTSLPLNAQQRGYTLHSNGTIWFVTGGFHTPGSNLVTQGVTANYTIAQGVDNFVITENHHTIRVFNSINSLTLPTAATSVGRIYTLIGSNGIGTKSITGGNIYDDVTNTAITTIGANQRFTIQSDGTTWIVIGR
ncbi:MAG: hypothetical protein Q4F57_07030 [Weeksellaceae bacterium]|nr:hypothetical protein [Weeksellaceae bacterium]